MTREDFEGFIHGTGNGCEKIGLIDKTGWVSKGTDTI